MISVVIPTRNPHPDRLRRSLAGLGGQTLPSAQWELIVVDNASNPPVGAQFHPLLADLGAQIVNAPVPGLTLARVAGLRAARGDVVVFVDDDNVLDRAYLEKVARVFDRLKSLGAAGGPVIPEWETPPPPWTTEFHGLLALRNLGSETQVARGRPEAAWPRFAPVGAGLAVRRQPALAYAEAISGNPWRLSLDRAGSSLASGGDNDLVFTILHQSWDVGYFPELRLSHLIPASRLDPRYLAQLNRGIMRTWVRVLALHGQCPWKQVARVTVPLRAARAWVRLRTWRGPAERVRWAGARGQFEGQADLRGLRPPAA